jgi:selenocysteine insertion sequence-binding protein 2
LARVGELPVLYKLNKRKLCKALGKSIKVLVVGIQNADGTHDQIKKLKKMLGFT